MKNYDNNADGNKDFTTQVRERVQEKLSEYYNLLHEKERISVLIEHTKNYIDKLNSFLEAEGQSPIRVKESPKGSGFGKPGNRSADFPVRKVEWLGMTLEEIVRTILEASPNEVYHANVIAHKIYEIKNENDVRKVKRSLVSTLRRGADNKGLWEAIKGNKYKAKITNQERLIKV